MAMVKCLTETCIAKIPATKVRDWEGKCPKCNGVQQENRSYPAPFATKKEVKAPKVWKGYVKCVSCVAQIPQAMAEEHDGKCPKCRGIIYQSPRRNK